MRLREDEGDVGMREGDGEWYEGRGRVMCGMREGEGDEWYEGGGG